MVNGSDKKSRKAGARTCDIPRDTGPTPTLFPMFTKYVHSIAMFGIKRKDLQFICIHYSKVTFKYTKFNSSQIIPLYPIMGPDCVP